MTREMQSGQVGAPLFLSRCIEVVDEDGVQTGQSTNCVCLFCCVHGREWTANAVCALVLVSCCGLKQKGLAVKEKPKSGQFAHMPTIHRRGNVMGTI